MKLTNMQALEEAAECLRVLAHPHRLRMVQMMLQERLTVGQLADACGLRSAAASDHLRLLHRCRFVNPERAGRTVYYRIAEPHLASILQCIESRFGVDEVDSEAAVTAESDKQ